MGDLLNVIGSIIVYFFLLICGESIGISFTAALLTGWYLDWKYGFGVEKRG